MPGSGVPGSQKEDGFGAEPVGNTEFQGQNLCKKLVGWDYVYWNMVKEWLYSVSKRELPSNKNKTKQNKKNSTYPCSYGVYILVETNVMNI